MEAKDLIQVPAQAIDMKPRADKSWKLTFETRELSGGEVALLADSLQGEGWLVFSPNKEVTAKDVPKETADSGTKSQSQRLRDVLYVAWKSRGGKGSFQAYYNVALEKLVEHVKENIVR